jgi:methionyl-tRNA synthetase
MEAGGGRVARIFVGVSWPYANGPQHLGHLASTYVPADIFARYHRLRGDEVLMVSGSDMHGTPILVAAEKEGSSPSALAERYHAVNRDALARLGISFDVYTSTRTLLHERTAQELFLSLLEKGFLRRRTEEAPYCPQHHRFLPDRYLVGTCPYCGFESARGDECDRCGRPLDARKLGHPRCAIDGAPAEFRRSEHFYLELDRLGPDLARYLARVGEHWRPSVLHVAENFLAEGLRPTPITRDLDWGVPLPLDGYESKRMYVWFEALIGYLSAAREWAVRAGRPDAWRRYWDEREPARHYYFVGKDNKFHHTIVWPAMLIGVGGLQLPYDVPANEWLTLGGEKVSKSRSREQDAFLPSLLDRFSPDVIRFYAALLAPQNHDTELDWDEFDKVREDQLANQFGNLVQRTLVFVRDRYGGRVPAAPGAGATPEAALTAAELRAAHERITEEYEAVRLKEALDLVLEQVRSANRHFQEAHPWDRSEPERTVAIVDALARLRAIVTWLAPVLPFSCEETFRMLGFGDGPGAGSWDAALAPVPPGQALGPVRPLFPRELPSAASRPPPGGPGTAAEELPLPPLAARAGVIRAVANHPSADKLYVLEVDVGEPKRRTIVAGLRPSYSAEQLHDRRIVFLSNLAPRTIRRMTSQGMVLAADVGDRAVLLAPPAEIPPGAFVAGATEADREISYDEFARTPLAVGRAIGPLGPGATRFSLGSREVTAPGDWSAGTEAVVRLARADATTAEVLSFGPGAPVRPSEPVPEGAKVR